MASSQPLFQVTVDYSLTPTKAPCNSQIEFLLHIRTFLEDDNGGFQEDHSQDFQDFSVWPEFVFGSHRHRNNVARRLLEAGWLEQRGLETILDHTFSISNLFIEYEKKKKSRYSKGFNNVIRIILSVKKYVSREHDDELAAAMAMELSMQEAPRLVPATKESIKALKKVKLVEGYGEGIECMICMEKLVQSKTEVVTCMPCSHLFHGDCIDKWLSTGHHCPLCRFSMPTVDGKH